jgi:hypothetical protein
MNKATSILLVAFAFGLFSFLATGFRHVLVVVSDYAVEYCRTLLADHVIFLAVLVDVAILVLREGERQLLAADLEFSFGDVVKNCGFSPVFTFVRRANDRELFSCCRAVTIGDNGSYEM